MLYVYKYIHITAYTTQQQKIKQSNLKLHRILEYTFLQRKPTDSQQEHEKMLNTVNHQKNTNQNLNEISPHTCQNGYHRPTKSTNNKCWKGYGKRKLLYMVGRNVNWFHHCGKQYEIVSKAKIQ